MKLCGGEQTMGKTQVRKLFSKLQRGVTSAVDPERSGRPSTAEKVTTWFE